MAYGIEIFVWLKRFFLMVLSIWYQYILIGPIYIICRMLLIIGLVTAYFSNGLLETWKNSPFQLIQLHKFRKTNISIELNV